MNLKTQHRIGEEALLETTLLYGSGERSVRGEVRGSRSAREEPQAPELVEDDRVTNDGEDEIRQIRRRAR